MHIGEKIKKYRKARGMTFAAFSELSGISAPTLCRIEQGADMRVTTMLKFCKVFGMDPNTFLEYKPE